MHSFRNLVLTFLMLCNALFIFGVMGFPFAGGGSYNPNAVKLSSYDVQEPRKGIDFINDEKFRPFTLAVLIFLGGLLVVVSAVWAFVGFGWLVKRSSARKQASVLEHSRRRLEEYQRNAIALELQDGTLEQDAGNSHLSTHNDNRHSVESIRVSSRQEAAYQKLSPGSPALDRNSFYMEVPTRKLELARVTNASTVTLAIVESGKSFKTDSNGQVMRRKFSFEESGKLENGEFVNGARPISSAETLVPVGLGALETTTTLVPAETGRSFHVLTEEEKRAWDKAKKEAEAKKKAEKKPGFFGSLIQRYN